LIEALIALQADQLGAVHGGQRLGDLGLADAGLAFEQQRALEQFHQRDRGRQFAVGDVAAGRPALARSLRDLSLPERFPFRSVIAASCRHCEERSDEAIHGSLLDCGTCFAALAMPAQDDELYPRNTPSFFAARQLRQ
jgi:hypothetical protein